MFVSVVICSILFFSAQGNDLSHLELEAQEYLKGHNEFLTKMKTWLEEMAQNLKAEMNRSSSELQALPSILLEEGKAQLNLHYVESLEQLRGMAAPEQCINDGQQQLMQLHQNNLNSFFACKNITTGVEDILKMGWDTLKLTTQILVTADEVLNGLGKCFSWNPIKFIYCTFEWVKDTLSDIFKSFKAIVDFNKNISELAKDMKNQFEYCLHGGKTTALENHLAVIKSINECSKKSYQ